MARPKNPYIQELRELGVTDYQRRLLRQTIKIYEEEDVYTTIEDLNTEVLGQRIRPTKLSYQTAVALLQHGVYSDIRELLGEYKQEYKYAQEDTTSEIENYLSRLTNELIDIGVGNATVDKLREADLQQIEYWYSYYKQYEQTGNKAGMHYCRTNLIVLVG